MDALDNVVDPLRDFAKDSVRLVKRCHKPDRKEFSKVAFPHLYSYQQHHRRLRLGGCDQLDKLQIVIKEKCYSAALPLSFYILLVEPKVLNLN
ncbi:hypothetical protein V6N13_099579 [Hibiscus sabdariffa]